MPEKNVLREVDDEARRLAGTLLRTSRHGSLGALEPGTGVPLVSRVSLATAVDGAPVFLISQLSAHFGALEADPRCSLLLGEPGKGDPLAHPRMTLIGRAEKTEGAARATLRTRFLARHPKAALYADFGDFAFWRVGIERASLNGGFGKAFELGVNDLATTVPDDMGAMEPGVVEHMNDDHADAVKLYAEALLGEASGDWVMTGMDPEGLDMAAGDRIARLWFDKPLKSAEEVRPRLVALTKQARAKAG